MLQNERNNAVVKGLIEEEFTYSHEVRFEKNSSIKFYRTRVVTERLSGIKDFVPIIASEQLLVNNGAQKGKFVEVTGQLRSHRKLGEDGLFHLELFLFADSIVFYEDAIDDLETQNMVYLEGCLWKPPVLRTTPFGRRIADMLVKVDRNYKKADYITCIAWGECAEFVAQLKIFDNVSIIGRIQSREYFKRISPNSEETEKRTTYEVSTVQFAKI